MSVRNGILAALAVLVLVGLWIGGMALGLYGHPWHAGEPVRAAIPAAVRAERDRAQQRAAATLSPAPSEQILFGDLHVHTTFSTDAFLRALPMMGGDGAHPVSDACDFARFCSALDFWSINDHAEASTPRRWRETRESIRACNAVTDPASPDMVAFLGWEWSQVGLLPEDHYGHKNVIFRGLADDEVPARAIGAAGLATEALRGAAATMPKLLPLLDLGNRQLYYDFVEFMQEIESTPRCPEGVPSPELPDDCYESAATPAELFEKLDQWGFETIVIPHGNTWGFYSPPGITLDKQLTAAQNDPSKQLLFEIFSGHGNSEEYRDWRGAEQMPDGSVRCPEPTPDYTPACWRAGEIIEARCHDAGESDEECARRAAEARANHVWLGQAGQHTVPGVQAADWLDAGQCRDCFLPSFQYRPGGSAQYSMAITNFDSGEPRRFRFGFIGSSDNHQARPGTGFKEFGRRTGNTEAAGPASKAWARRLGGPESEPAPRSVRIEREDMRKLGLRALDTERQAAFFMTGGLAAVHAAGRSRDAIWSALRRKEVYATSGDRILLWFNLLNAEGPDGSLAALPMGSATRMATTPRFEVRAVGAFEQKQGCPDYSVRSLSPDQLQKLCQGECYNPGEHRKRIARIEVVRVRPQAHPGEPVASLIEDPWRTFECPPSESGCVVQFEDADFGDAARDTAYYVRAVEPPTPTVNADPLRCERDEEGRCIEAHPCFGDYRVDASDDCLAPSEERAWSSPIFVDWSGAAVAPAAGG